MKIVKCDTSQYAVFPASDCFHPTVCMKFKFSTAANMKTVVFLSFRLVHVYSEGTFTGVSKVLAAYRPVDGGNRNL